MLDNLFVNKAIVKIHRSVKSFIIKEIKHHV